MNNGGCSRVATCTNTPGGSPCTCLPGYTGDGYTCIGKKTYYAISVSFVVFGPENGSPTATDVVVVALLVWKTVVVFTFSNP